MTNTSKTLIFFGNERLASGIKTDAPILSGLIEAGYDIPFIVVSQAQTSGRNKRKLEVAEVADKHGIPVKYISKLREITDEIIASQASFGVLAAFGRIVPQSTIDLFEHGILNIHPSLLPEFRGSSPIESAILSGQKITGVSLMKLSAGMDEGPVLGFAETEITTGMSKQELYNQLSTIGAGLLTTLLPQILNGELTPLEQDHDNATYSSKLSKENSAIDWHKPASQIEKEIRAYADWPSSKTNLGGTETAICQTELFEANGSPGQIFKISKSRFGIYCGENALEILSLKPQSKSQMTAAAFMAGNNQLFN
jgi:methionyl-tRNA formyltransferase